jgi:hypothetical protein
MLDKIKETIEETIEDLEDNKTVKRILKVVKKSKILTFLVAGFIAYEILGENE